MAARNEIAERKLARVESRAEALAERLEALIGRAERLAELWAPPTRPALRLFLPTARPEVTDA